MATSLPDPDLVDVATSGEDRRETDQWLRDWGYAIRSRPNRGEPLWTHGIWREGKPVFTQSEALRRIERLEDWRSQSA